eukprot:TRINITY_DN8933_c0_g1_i1.p1 TRINITY_DN8933_c0_g1~~TRINITY_DN8933_c0_g1_i1.p1  ORF type:complete len:409 (+),score=77.95 TRINITY_DN8933_c0_g1_i1:51-1229(+)
MGNRAARFVVHEHAKAATRRERGAGSAKEKTGGSGTVAHAGLLLYARMPTGAVVAVDLPATATVRDLKQAVEDAGGPRSMAQRLMNGLEELADDSVELSDTLLCMESTVAVMRAARRRRSVVSTSWTHALALLQDGSVVGWGKLTAWHPIPDFGGRRVVSVHAGINHSAAVLSDRTLVTWGQQGSRLRGNDIRVVSYSAAPGSDYSVAVVEGGGVIHGGHDQPDLPPDADVYASDANVEAVSTGDAHAVFLTSGGDVVEVGEGIAGRAWDLGGQRAVDVAASASRSFALLDNGSVLCRNAVSGASVSDAPPNIAAVACGGADSFAFALTDSGKLMVWGRPPWVPDTSARFIAASACCGYCIGVTADAHLCSWGSNSYGRCNVPRHCRVASPV